MANEGVTTTLEGPEPLKSPVFVQPQRNSVDHFLAIESKLNRLRRRK